MKDNIIFVMKQKYDSEISQHKLNIDIMMANPRAIPEHENFAEAIDKELTMMADAKDKLDLLKNYF
jgi:hypothetical protein